LGYLDGSIDVRDPVTGATLERLPPGPAAYSLAFRPDDDRILVASIWETREVRVHDLKTGEVLRLPHPYEVRGIAWHPGGKLLAAACSDGDIYIWDAIKRTGRPRSILNGHQAPPRWLSFNHAGDLLASSGWDGTIRLWDPWNAKQRVVSPGYDWPPQFSPDDSRLAFGLDRRNIGIWEVAAGHEYRTLWGHEGPGVSPHTMDVSPDGRLLASAGADGVRIWDMEKARQVASLDVGGCITTLFQGDGKALLVSDQAGVRRWPIDLTLRDGDIHVRVGAPRTLYEEPGARWLSLSRAANLLVVADPVHQRAVVISLADPAKRIALGPHRDVNKTAISPDARWVATSTWHGASGTRVWDLGTGRLAKDLSGGDAHVAFSPDGRWLVAGTEADYRCWAIDSWEPRWRIPRDHASVPGPMAFSADGRTLAIALSNKLARLIDAATGRVLADLTAPDPLPISWMCFCPDAGRLAVASGNHSINLWDLRRIRRQLAGMNLDW
jgi:WD40 repeat protein